MCEKALLLSPKPREFVTPCPLRCVIWHCQTVTATAGPWRGCSRDPTDGTVLAAPSFTTYFRTAASSLLVL